ncbi:MAG: Ig-like domain-containing protein [Myxococcales bacterium]
MRVSSRTLHHPGCLFAAFLLGAFLPEAANAAPSLGTASEWDAVPTFQSIGLYWAPAGRGAGVAAQVWFKEAGTPESSYRQGLDLWFDDRNSEYRGSLVELKPGTTYDIKLALSTGLTKILNTAGDNPAARTTWSETFPVPAGNTVNVQPGIQEVDVFIADIPAPTSTVSGTTQNIRIPLSNSAQSWVLITAPAGQNVIDQTNSASQNGCIDIEPGAQYLIIRGLELRNCQRNAIRLARNETPSRPTHHIVIEDNDIHGWGGIGAPSDPNGFEDAGVMCHYWHETNNALRPNQIVIQRNKFYNPRYSARPWVFGHPSGPEAVHFERCGVNHVIRYNEVFANNGNHFEDGLSGSDNSSPASEGFNPVFTDNAVTGSPGMGFPWADSDIYGNKISDAYDDGIEAEGANRNVRIWANYLDNVGIVFGNAATSVGPLYVWRNISNSLAWMKQTRFSLNEPAGVDNEDRGPFIKGGTDSGSFNGGRAYYFHNTVLQPPPQAGAQNRSGAGGGIFNAGGANYNYVSLNNIWQAYRTTKFPAIDASNASASQQATIQANHDLYNTFLAPTGLGAANAEQQGIIATPHYASATAADPTYPDLTSQPGNFSLAANTSGYHAGTPILNFNDQYALPDIGAHQSGTPPMKFGPAAATSGGPVGPTAHLTAQQATSPALTASFDATTSTAGSSPIASYSINFGDGASGAGAQQTHTYAAAGTYTATLTVTDANGLTSSDVRSVTITGTPPAPGPSAFELDFSVNPGPIARAGESIDFVVAASDGRALQSVKFTLDGVVKATITTAPYQYTWSSLATDTAGSHTIVVDATDTAGKTSTKTRALTLLAQPCTGTATPASVTQGDAVQVQATCSAHESVGQVELWVDGAQWNVDVSAPWSFTLDTSSLAPGSHTVAIIGRLASGDSTRTLTVQVAGGPLNLIFKPGAVVMRGDALTVDAVAADGRALKQVDFSVDGEFQRGETVSPFELIADTNIAAGRHTLLVQATDTAGNVLTATREIYLNTRTCNVLVSTRMYRASSQEAVKVGPLTIRQGDPIAVEGICSGWNPVQQMEFYLDGVLQSTDTTAPTYVWTLKTSSLAVGNHTIGITGRLSPSGVSNHSITIEIAAP